MTDTLEYRRTLGEVIFCVDQLRDALLDHLDQRQVTDLTSDDDEAQDLMRLSRVLNDFVSLYRPDDIHTR